jgi:uncharacterized BrkB/YihY/UPF0761 family membrane protein
MDPETQKALEVLDQKLNAIYESVEKTRKYFLASVIITVVMFVLPLLGLAVAIPVVMSTFSSAYEGLL